MVWGFPQLSRKHCPLHYLVTWFQLKDYDHFTRQLQWICHEAFRVSEQQTSSSLVGPLCRIFFGFQYSYPRESTPLSTHQKFRFFLSEKVLLQPATCSLPYQTMRITVCMGNSPPAYFLLEFSPGIFPEKSVTLSIDLHSIWRIRDFSLKPCARFRITLPLSSFSVYVFLMDWITLPSPAIVFHLKLCITLCMVGGLTQVLLDCSISNAFISAHSSLESVQLVPAHSGLNFASITPANKVIG